MSSIQAESLPRPLIIPHQYDNCKRAPLRISSSMAISSEHILESSLQSLINHANQLDTEQAVRGSDALSELEFHPIIEQSLKDTGLGVHRETHYPGEGDAYTSQTHRQRCDLVLTPNPDLRLLDPATELRQLALAQNTLFAGLPQAQPDPSTTCPPEDAWWIEIKSCAQHAYRDGVPSPNPRYAHELVTGLQTDLCKLSEDPHIWHGFVLVILFTESEEIARHDLNQAARICLNQDLPIRSPLIGSHSITDRAGNGCCSVGLFPVKV